MKKLLLRITGITLLLILGLVSCTIDSDPLTKLQPLAATAKVTATPYGSTGTIRVNWEPVDKALIYQVYRKSVAPGQGGETAFKFIGTVQNNYAYLGIDDVISFDNIFKQDYTYTYRVAALASGTDSFEYGTVWNLQNSYKDSNQVKFDATTNVLAAEGAQLTAPAITFDTRKHYWSNYIGEELLVSFNAQPGVNYTVYYSYGSDQLIPNGGSDFVKEINPAIKSDPKTVVTFPLISGKTNVKLVAKPKSYNYYKESDPTGANYTGAKTVLEPVYSFWATGYNHAIQLQWSDVPGATGYDVYRFTGTSGGYNSGGYIFDDWTDITTQISPHKDDGAGWTALDTSFTDDGQSFVYMIIAKNDTGKSFPITAQATREVSNNYSLSATPMDWDTETKDYKGINITWVPKAGQTYRLYRVAVNYDSVNGGVTGPESGSWNYTEVTNVAPPNNDYANYSVIDKPPVRHSYRYKLVTTQNGITSEQFADFASYPYRADQLDVSLSITGSPAVANNTAAQDATWSYNPYYRGTAYTIGVTITNKDQLNKLLATGETVKVYRVKATSSWDSTEIGSYTEVTLDTAAYTNLLAGKEFVDGPLDPGYYKYKAEVVSGGKALRNTTYHEDVVSTAYSYSSPSIQLTPTGTAKRFEYTSYSQYEYIFGTKLQLRYIDANDWPANFDTATTVDLTYARTPNSADINTVNLYYTANIPLPSASATTTRYYQLYVRTGYGTLSQIDPGTITPIP